MHKTKTSKRRNWALAQYERYALTEEPRTMTITHDDRNQGQAPQFTPVSQTDEMLTYIRRIRNEQKRYYAIRYSIWLMRSEEDKAVIVEPRPCSLSYMAAQAVRMELHRIARR